MSNVKVPFGVRIYPPPNFVGDYRVPIKPRTKFYSSDYVSDFPEVKYITLRRMQRLGDISRWYAIDWPDDMTREEAQDYLDDEYKRSIE